MTDRSRNPLADDVDITAELVLRTAREPNFAAEVEAYSLLARELSENPANMLQKLTDLIVEMNVGQSAGISIWEKDTNRFRWDALSGAWAKFKGDSMPFDASPCGLVIRGDRMMLFRNPERAFPGAMVDPLIREILLVPFRVDGQPVGTLWINAHDDERKFDMEDARLLLKLTDFAAAGYQMARALGDARAGEQTNRRALRASEKRYQELFNSIDEGFCVIEVLFDDESNPVDYRFLETNASFEKQTGLKNAVGKRMRALEPSHEQHWFDIYGEIALSGEPRRFEDCAEALGHWYDVYAFRIGAPELCRVAILFNDIKERKLAEIGLRESEARLRTLMQGIPQLVWRAQNRGEWTWSSPQWQAYTGQSYIQSKGLGWLGAVHPEDRERAGRCWAEAEKAGEFEVEYRIHHAASDNYRWFQTRASPVRDSGDNVIEWLGTSTDVEDIKLLHERQKLLLAELQHRVRNILATVRSLIRQSSLESTSVEEYSSHLIGRLDALARTQILLTRAAGAKVNLENVLRDEIDASGAEDDRLIIAGPDVMLSPKAAEILTLALHELTTNSIKYGVLGRNEGHLAINWSLESRADDSWLNFSWRERGLDGDVRPSRKGFGAELIEQRVPYELKGEGKMEFSEAGVTIEFAFPIAEGASTLETEPRNSHDD